jgi:hypothetical protein
MPAHRFTFAVPRLPAAGAAAAAALVAPPHADPAVSAATTSHAFEKDSAVWPLGGTARGGEGTRSTKLFYGGDFDGRASLANEADAQVADARVYDDVRWPGSWSVTELYSRNCIDFVGSAANWEVRAGISSGNGGTVLATGKKVAATWTLIDPQGCFGLGELYEVKVAVPAFTLPGGHYWINVQPVGSGSGVSLQVTTSGAMGVGGPLHNGQAYFDSTSFGYHFAPVGTILGTGTWDFSGGVNGP